MQEPPDKPRTLQGLKELMAALRSPDGGCPWDLEQDHASIARYAVEEAYEVVDAIERQDDEALKNELGDLLLQVVFHSRMAEERGVFTLEDVAEAIISKMIRRHPHVFGTEDGRNADEQTVAWEDIKEKERLARGASSLLDDVPVTLPALTRAEKLTKRAARAGFEWDKPEHILDKLDEEIAELRAAMAAGDRDNMEEELGDIAFCVANIGRRLKIDTETAARRTNEKFIARFGHLEARARANGRDLADHSLGELEAFWQEAKKNEKSEKS